MCRALVAALACAIASSGIIGAQPPDEAGLHAALLSSPVLVDPVRLAMPPVARTAASSSRPSQFDALPTALLALLAHGTDAAGVWTAADFSAPAVLATKDQIDAFVEAESAGRGSARTAAFPPETTAVVRLSRALVTSDQLDAVVYGEWYCGTLCGEGAYVWFHRDRADAEWRERKRITRWIS
jgi:hypothetical protein